MPGTAGSAGRSGILTDIAVAPPSAKSASLPDTNSPMSCCASSVDPPMCGVKITFGTPAQLGGDELLAAPLRLLREDVDGRARDVPGLDVPAQRGVVDDEAARQVLRKSERGFIKANSSSPKNPWLPTRSCALRDATSGLRRCGSIP